MIANDNARLDDLLVAAARGQDDVAALARIMLRLSDPADRWSIIESLSRCERADVREFAERADALSS